MRVGTETPTTSATGETSHAEKRKPSAFSQLNPQQQKFVTEYLERFNATKAAIAAGYSEDRAEHTGYDLRQNPTVAEAIAEGLTSRGITEARISSAIAELAFDQDASDFEQAVESGTPLKELKKAGVNTKFVKSISRSVNESGVNRKVELHDRLKALELLGKVRAMFTEKRQLTGADGGPVVIVNKQYVQSANGTDRVQTDVQPAAGGGGSPAGTP